MKVEVLGSVEVLVAVRIGGVTVVDVVKLVFWSGEGFGLFSFCLGFFLFCIFCVLSLVIWVLLIMIDIGVVGVVSMVVCIDMKFVFGFLFEILGSVG